jgi:hypothetical protein
MRAACLGLVLFTTSLAHASPEEILGEEQLVLQPWRDVLDEGDEAATKKWVRFAGFAQLTGGGRSYGDAGAGAAIGVGGAGCELARVSVHGRFRPLSTQSEVLGKATYSVCPIAFGFTLKFDGHRGTGTVPSIDARRSLWNRAYTDAYDSMTMAFGPFEQRSGAHSFMPLTFGHGEMKQSDGLQTRKTVTLDLDLAVYRLERRRGDDSFGLDAIALTVDALKAGVDNKGGVATSFMPVRLRASSGPYYANVQAGWGIVGGQFTSSSKTEVDGETVSEWSETIDSEGLPEFSTWAGELEAGVRLDRFEASATASRWFFPTFDGNVAREARIAGNLTWRAGRTKRTTLALSPFAARTRTWERMAGSTRDIAAGASLHVGREINEKLRVDAIGEAGVSPYARTETERLEGGHFGGQLMVAISGRVTELHR